MSDRDKYRLADSTAVEPLINNWVAWSDLISPVSYSLHMLNYQMKTLSSYLADPQIHIKACQNLKFLGGPFVDIPVDRANEVEELFQSMEKNQNQNIELAQAIIQFYNDLVQQAKGQSIEPYYQNIPDPLRGYVELLYDYHNHPIVRVFESLLYKSHYYKKNLQSLRIFQQPHDNYRNFFLSTPRLPGNKDQIDWSVPFESTEINEFFKLEKTHQPLGHIYDILGLSPIDNERLLPLLTTKEISPPEQWNGSGARIRYFGHACVLVEWNGISVLTDPWIGVISTEKVVDRFSYKHLPEEIDYALITHGHHDHFVVESLLRLRSKIKCLVVPRTFGLFYADTSLKHLAQQIGYEHVIEMDALDSIKIPDGEIIAVPFLGEHADLAHGKSAYIVRSGKEQTLFAADSNCLDKSMYEHLRQILGPIETVFLGMECEGAPLSWLYGALMPIQLQRSHDLSRRTRACDSTAAEGLINAVGAKRVYNYALGCEPWLEYSMGLAYTEDSIQIKESDRFLSKAHEKGIEAKRLFGQFETYIGYK